MGHVTKAVFPVAGLGSRFLPATKALAKEMLPIVDKPLIQYAVEEAAAAGITQCIFVTSRHKRSIEDHFDSAPELEAELSARGKTQILSELRSIMPAGMSFVYIRQAQALGLGHAVLQAQSVVGNEPFAVMLPDDLIAAKTPVMAQMSQAFARTQCSLLGAQEVPREDTASYGIVAISESGAFGVPECERVSAIVEKPRPEVAPSRLAVIGRYVLTARIFHHLQTVRPGAGGEIQLTDGIASLMSEEPVLTYRFEGVRYDCGSKLGYVQATHAYALAHPELGAAFQAYLDDAHKRQATGDDTRP